MGARHFAAFLTSPCLQRVRKTGDHGRLFGIAAALIAVLIVTSLAAKSVEVPVIKGNLGPCSADFTVTDSANKPIYNAKIHVTILYGFMNKRKTELEIGTNSDGKARVEGLPTRVKKSLEFHIRSGELSKSVMHDPEVECQASFNVVLGKQ